MVVTDKLVKHFPQLFDVHFTADMEDQLDRIEEAKADWVRVLKKFYGPFSKTLKKASKDMVHAKAETQPSDYKCEACGKAMVYRFSKTGRYLACTGYPDCKETHPVDEEGQRIRVKLMDVACPKCGKQTVLRTGRYGPFLSCSTYPECKGIVNLDRKGLIKPPSRSPLQIDLPCPKCDAPLNLRRSKRGPWLGCSKFPKCRGRQAWKTLPDDLKETLEKQLADHEKAEPLLVLKDLSGKAIPPNHEPQEIPEEALQAANADGSGKP
jgi:DNA topoisomerase-1